MPKHAEEKRSVARFTLPALMLIGLCGCGKGESADSDEAATAGAGPAGRDSAFEALQQRGQAAMGVDQYASVHVFEPLPDGGRIVLQMKTADSTGESVIRAHMRDIARAFGSGDFRIPGRVHATSNVPGTAVMSRLRAQISYAAKDLDRGGEVRITTRNAEATAAVHEFLSFQRQDHRAGVHRLGS